MSRSLEAAKEKYPQAQPRIISDNGPQFIGTQGIHSHLGHDARENRLTSAIQRKRWHQSLKSECIRPGVPLKDARRLIERYVVHYNTVRLHSAIGYVTPLDMLTGRQAQIPPATGNWSTLGNVSYAVSKQLADRVTITEALLGSNPAEG